MNSILFSGSTQRSGTTAYIFSKTQFGGSIGSLGYAVFDSNDKIQKIDSFSDENFWVRNEKNNFSPIQEVYDNFLTGYTIVQNSDQLLSESQKLKLKRKVPNKIPDQLGKDNNYVIFEDNPIDDMFYNVSVKQTFDSLDTFSVYNTLTNSFPVQEGETGVVFGKLEAIQKIKNVDSNSGENLRIPLRNVPIGIFTPSEDFPDTTSVDENGERVKYNFKYNFSNGINSSLYSNQESLDTDAQFLADSSSFSGIPDQYDLMTTTNNEGEFIIYNVPVGDKFLVFDVDILQQGLTEEEVSLNFFPYPTDNNPNISNVPHYFYRQVPITVLPCWGSFQTGYTEVNVSANIDLRKWVTYFLPPCSYGEKTLIELTSQGFLAQLKVQVRDMTKDNLGSVSKIPGEIGNLTPSQLVRVDVTSPRNGQQEIGWQNEFSNKSTEAIFSNTEYNAIKLPANIYHPFLEPSYSFDKNQGFKTLGAWFAGYEINLTIDEQNYRTTGYVADVFNAENGRDHFRLNRNVNANPGLDNSVDLANDSSLDSFPYEKPWSYKYPSIVNIAGIPDDLANNVNPGIDSYKYLDGDKVGDINSNSLPDTNKFLSYGFGLQNFKENEDTFLENDFARTISSKYVYLVEPPFSNVSTYSTGWRSKNKQSEVKNPDLYQRMEAGYAYWLRPDGWPKVRMENNIEYLDLNTSTDIFIPKDGQFKVTLDLLNTAGGLNFYRVYKPGPNFLLSPRTPPIPTFVDLNIGEIYRKIDVSTSSGSLLARGKDAKDKQKNSFTRLGQGISDLGQKDNRPAFLSISIDITNTGELPSKVGEFEVNPGDTVSFSFIDSWPPKVRIQANSSYSPDNNKFLGASYKLNIRDDSNRQTSGSQDMDLLFGLFYNGNYRNIQLASGDENNPVYKLGDFDPVEENGTIPQYYAFTDFKPVSTKCGDRVSATAKGVFIEPGGVRAEDNKGLFFTRLAESSPGSTYEGRPTGQLGNMRRNTGVGSQFDSLLLPVNECSSENDDDFFYFETVISKI